MTKVIKESDGSISIFEITEENEIIFSGDGWREGLGKNKRPKFGTCKSGKFADKEQALSVLSIIISQL